jgi:hypothetical protein
LKKVLKEHSNIVGSVRNGIKAFMPGHVPDFLIVGAQKSATTSVHYYLSQHPKLIGSRPKEVCFFDRDENYERGVSWYKHNFPNTKSLLKNHKYFESTPEYLYRTYVAERIHKFNPDLKIIILLRDPVQRAFSAWSMYKTFKNRKNLPLAIVQSYTKEKGNNLFDEFYSSSQFPDFKSTVNEDIRKFNTNDQFEEPSIVRRGIYYQQVKRYTDLFGKKNILILGFKDVISTTKHSCLNQILQFINLPTSDWKFLKDEAKNMKRSEELIPKDVEELLTIFYKPHNEMLFDLIGFKPNW